MRKGRVETAALGCPSKQEFDRRRRIPSRTKYSSFFDDVIRTMKTLTVSVARKRFGALLNAVQEEPVLVCWKMVTRS